MDLSCLLKKKIFKLTHKTLQFGLRKNPFVDAKSGVESLRDRIFAWFPKYLLIDYILAARR